MSASHLHPESLRQGNPGRDLIRHQQRAGQEGKDTLLLNIYQSALKLIHCVNIQMLYIVYTLASESSFFFFCPGSQCQGSAGLSPHPIQLAKDKDGTES